MPVNTDQLKERTKEVLDAKLEVTRLTSKPYELLNAEERFAIRYHIIVLAEALGSICLHIAAEDLGLKSQSYSECFKIMEEKKICGNCAKDLASMILLRNLLTYQYWKINDGQVYDSIKNDFQSVDRFSECVTKICNQLMTRSTSTSLDERKKRKSLPSFRNYWLRKQE